MFIFILLKNSFKFALKPLFIFIKNYKTIKMTKHIFNFIMKVFLTSKVMDCLINFILIHIAIVENLNVSKNKIRGQKKSYSNLSKKSACPARRQLA